MMLFGAKSKLEMIFPLLLSHSLYSLPSCLLLLSLLILGVLLHCLRFFLFERARMRYIIVMLPSVCGTIADGEPRMRVSLPLHGGIARMLLRILAASNCLFLILLHNSN